jgi:dolichol-phosphate mannosyltransferase
MTEAWHACIVLPTYNERDNVELMTHRLLEAVPEAQVLIVDDSSPDGTGEIADGLASRDDRVRVLHRAEKNGLGAAYRAAFQHVLAESPDRTAIVQMDCDFSHDPADVPRLLSALAEGADLVIGSRYVPGGGTPGWSVGRRALSRGGSAFAHHLLRLPPHDLTGGFKAWSAPTLARIPLDQIETRGYGFQIEMTWRAHRDGARVTEIPITFHERRAGTSKMNRRIVLEALLMVMRLRLRAS